MDFDEAPDWNCCGDPTNTASSYARCSNPHCHHRRIHMASKKRKGGNKKKGYGR